MRLRIFAEAFDYNLRFLILAVPYNSYEYILYVSVEIGHGTGTVLHVVPRGEWAAAGAYEYEYEMR